MTSKTPAEVSAAMAEAHDAEVEKAREAAVEKARVTLRNHMSQTVGDHQGDKLLALDDLIFIRQQQLAGLHGI